MPGTLEVDRQATHPRVQHGIPIVSITGDGDTVLLLRYYFWGNESRFVWGVTSAWPVGVLRRVVPVLLVRHGVGVPSWVVHSARGPTTLLRRHDGRSRCSLSLLVLLRANTACGLEPSLELLTARVVDSPIRSSTSDLWPCRIWSPVGWAGLR